MENKKLITIGIMLQLLIIIILIGNANAVQGDLDGDGIISPADTIEIQKLIISNQYNPLADLDNNGIIDYYDLSSAREIVSPKTIDPNNYISFPVNFIIDGKEYNTIFDGVYYGIYDNRSYKGYLNWETYESNLSIFGFNIEFPNDVFSLEGYYYNNTCTFANFTSIQSRSNWNETKIIKYMEDNQFIITPCYENETINIDSSKVIWINFPIINNTEETNETEEIPAVTNGGGSSGGGSSNYCDYEGTIHKSTYVLCKCKNNHETCRRSTSSIDTSVSQEPIAEITIEPIDKTPIQKPLELYPNPDLLPKKSYAWIWWIIGITILIIACIIGYTLWKEQH